MDADVEDEEDFVGVKAEVRDEAVEERDWEAEALEAGWEELVVLLDGELVELEGGWRRAGILDPLL